MRRILLLCALLVVASASASDDAAKRLLEQVEQRLRLNSAYRISFSLVAEGHSGEGVLHVEGENSHLLFGAEEIYIESGVRYIVAHDKREVVIDNNAAYRSNLFTNPSLGFRALLSDYDATLVTHGAQRSILLQPKGSATLDEAITILVRDDASVELILVGAGSSRLVITPRSVEYNAGAAPRYNASRYRGFEIMDFR